MSATEFVPNQNATEAVTAHVIWMTSGLGCDGDSVAMTSATNPSLEDIIRGIIPGMPRVVIHTPVLAYENGAEFLQAWYDAEARQARPVRADPRGLGPERGDQRRGPLGRDAASTRRTASRSRRTSGSTGWRRRPRPSSRSAPARPTAASRR